MHRIVHKNKTRIYHNANFPTTCREVRNKVTLSQSGPKSKAKQLCPNLRQSWKIIQYCNFWTTCPEVITSSQIATRLNKKIYFFPNREKVKCTCGQIVNKSNYNLCSTWVQVKTSVHLGQKLKDLSILLLDKLNYLLDFILS